MSIKLIGIGGPGQQQENIQNFDAANVRGSLTTKANANNAAAAINTKNVAVVRQSHATDIPTLVESQNSIFDKFEHVSSMSKAYRAGLATTKNNNLNNNVQHKNLKQQQLPVQQESDTKFKTFRDILDSIDEPNQDQSVGALRPSFDNRSSDKNPYGKYCGQSRVELFEKQFEQDNKHSSNLRTTQDSKQLLVTASGEPAQQRRSPSKATTILTVNVAQQSEGVLHWSQKSKSPEMNQPTLNIVVNQNNTMRAGQDLNLQVPNSSNLDLFDDRNIQKEMTVERTPQGIIKRVVKGKAKKGPLETSGLEIQAHSFEPDKFSEEDNYNSLAREKNNFVVMESHRVPVIVDQRVPALSDVVNTNLKNFETSQISMNINSTFRQQEQEVDGEKKPNCYLLLPWEDINLIIESINDDNEQMKIHFGCKALKSILLVSPAKLIFELIEKFGRRLLKRLVVVLEYQHLQDTMTEALHVIVLLTNLMDHNVTSEMVVAGLVRQLNRFIDTKFMQQRSNKMAAELALQIVSNVTQISNLAVKHMQEEFEPELKDDEEIVHLGLNFIDRMVTLCQLTEVQCSQITSPKSELLQQNDFKQNMNGKKDSQRHAVTTQAHQSIVQSQNTYSDQVGPTQMAELRIQLGYIAKHTAGRLKILEKENLAKITSLIMWLLIQSDVVLPKGVEDGNLTKFQNSMNQKHVLIQRSAMYALRMISSKSEYACEVLDKEKVRAKFASSLILIAQHCCSQKLPWAPDSVLLSLLMDTLVVLGDLVSSEYFTESVLFVENDLYIVLNQVLQSALIEKIDPIFNPSSEIVSVEDQSKNQALKLSKRKFQEIIAWTIANSIADDQRCQTKLIEERQDLLEACFSMTSISCEKINQEICYMIENILQNDEHIHKFLFGEEKPKKLLNQTHSSYKESEGEPKNQILPEPAAPVKKEQQKFVRILEVLTKILQDRPISKVGADDQNESKIDNNDGLDYQAIDNIRKIFKLNKRKVRAYVSGSRLNEDIGMSQLVEVIYKLEHHWSTRVYEKAILITSRYLRGNQSTKLHNLTSLYTELCQEKIFQPDPEVIDRTVIKFNVQAKNKSQSKRRDSDESNQSDGSVSDEEARDRAITFLMSIGEKRQYQAKKKLEKEFNERFKLMFSSIVENHLVNNSNLMKVIDMTQATVDGMKHSAQSPLLTLAKQKSSQKLLKKATSNKKMKKKKIKVDALDFDQIGDEQTLIPKMLLTYNKIMNKRYQKTHQTSGSEIRPEMIRIGSDSGSNQRHDSSNLGFNKNLSHCETGEDNGSRSMLGMLSQQNNQVYENNGFSEKKKPDSSQRRATSRKVSTKKASALSKSRSISNKAEPRSENTSKGKQQFLRKPSRQMQASSKKSSPQKSEHMRR